MLLESYKLEIFNSECNPGAMTVMCHAHLKQDVGEALPYLNAEIGGFEYVREPPAVTFRSQGKLITVHSRKIANNVIERCADCDVCRHLMDVNCLLFPEFRNLLKRGAYYAREYQEAIGAPGDMVLKPGMEKAADGTPRYLQYNKSIDGELYCCGMAGIMGFKQDFHESSRQLGQNLLDVLAKKAPALIVTDCLSCRLQFEQFTPFRVRHPIELL